MKIQFFKLILILSSSMVMSQTSLAGDGGLRFAREKSGNSGTNLGPRKKRQKYKRSPYKQKPLQKRNSKIALIQEGELFRLDQMYKMLWCEKLVPNFLILKKNSPSIFKNGEFFILQSLEKFTEFCSSSCLSWRSWSRCRCGSWRPNWPRWISRSCFFLRIKLFFSEFIIILVGWIRHSLSSSKILSNFYCMSAAKLFCDFYAWVSFLSCCCCKFKRYFIDKFNKINLINKI